ncbi:MAG: hypothetical protein ACXWNX_16560 [Isosphaeraceae bacterium]
MLTSPRKPFARFLLAELLVLLALPAARGRQSEPPALNPFGSRAEREDQKRDDAVPGFVEMSNGTLQNGQKIEGTQRRSRFWVACAWSCCLVRVWSRPCLRELA